MRLRGTWFVVPTPFEENGGLDEDSQRRILDAAIAWGVDGLTVLGVTSEATELSEEERARVLRIVAEVVGDRVPVVVGCSGADPDRVAARAAAAADAGAAAAMISAPPGFPEPAGLPAVYASARERGGLSIVVQDEPAATGVRMDHEVLLRCLDAAGSTTVKLEDPPTPPKIARLIAARPGLDVFGGLGGVAALYELRHGGCGTMTGFAFPEVLAAVRGETEVGNHRAAAAIFDRYLPLIQFEAQAVIGLGIRKELLRRRGVIATAVTRRPADVEAGTLADLDDVLDRVGVTPAPEPLPVLR